MTGEYRPHAPMTLSQRLTAIEKLETALVEKAHAILPTGAVNIVDFLVLCATQRKISQSTAFRTLIESRNFPSATVLLRTQIDTAMRINGLRMMANVEEGVQRIFNGERTFDRLLSSPVLAAASLSASQFFFQRRSSRKNIRGSSHSTADA
ncbi:hypothetical protein [Agrobacterium rosae]|uniref:hypothetical protein n=1 Tax=Agrobacterium rosae TaxID=1972867 RepID=UPI003BA0F415